MTCPFTGEELAAVPAHRPDVGIVHAQQADRAGNVQLWGITGVQKETVLASARSIVTVEEIVDELEPRPGGVVLPQWVVSAVCLAPHGAHPSYAHGYYDRDNDFYVAWEEISRDRDAFRGVDGDARARHRRLGGVPSPASRAKAVAHERKRLHGRRDDGGRGRAAARDGVVCFVGIGLPSLATNLARHTHAPGCVLIYESGTIGAKPVELPLSIGDGELAETADAVVSVPEMFAYWLQGGRIDVCSSARRRSTGTGT